MKQSLKNYLKFRVVLFSIPILIFTCKQEDDLSNKIDLNTSKRQINYLSEKEVDSDILNFVDKRIGSVFSKNKTKNNSTENTIDVSNIMQVIDSIGNVNYTFRIDVLDNDETTFYNLIVNQDLDGTDNIAYITKYKIDESYLENWIENNYDFNFFTGKRYRYNMDDFLNNFSYSNTSNNDTLNKNPDDCPCEEEEITNGTGNQSGVGNTTGGGGGGGLVANTVCTTIFTFEEVKCCDENYCYPHSPSTGSNYEGYCSGTTIIVSNTTCTIVYTSKSAIKTAQDDCLNPCDDEPTSGETGVVLPPNEPGEDDLLIGSIIEDNIISEDLDPCIQNILDELKNLQSSDIANVLSRFGNLTSTYNWEIKTGTPDNPNNAFETNWKEDSNENLLSYEYLTIVNTSYVNQATDLAIARVILHEAIHAYILSYVDDLVNNNTNTNIINDFQNDFSEIWNFYVAEQNGVEIGNIEDAHHEQMASSFIEVIGEALAEFDNNQEDIDYYYYLAWGALFNTDAWNIAIDFYDDEEDPNSIINAILIANTQEDTNGLDANGSPCP